MNASFNRAVEGMQNISLLMTGELGFKRGPQSRGSVLNRGGSSSGAALKSPTSRAMSAGSNLTEDCCSQECFISFRVLRL